MQTLQLWAAAALLLLGPLHAKEAGPDSMTFPVILEPIERTDVYPEINARIKAINVKMGDSFQTDDLLLRMENKVYYAQVEKTEKAVEKTKEDLSVKKSLYEKKLISYLELVGAEASLAEAEADYAIAHKNLISTIIIAPYSGKVAAVNARQYEIPPKDKPMLELINDKVLLAKFIVPASLQNNFKKGDTVYIYVKDLNKAFPATIARVGAEINPVSYTINVEAEIDNSKGDLTTGMASVVSLDKAAPSPSPAEGTIEEIMKELSKEK